MINDFILVRYNGNTRPLAENVDATIAGGELGVGYNFTDRLKTDLSAMYAWGENINDNTPLPQIAPLRDASIYAMSRINIVLGCCGE